MTTIGANSFEEALWVNLYYFDQRWIIQEDGREIWFSPINIFAKEQANKSAIYGWISNKP